MLVAIQHRVKFLVHARWNINYESLLSEMEESSRNDRVSGIANQLDFERK